MRVGGGGGNATAVRVNAAAPASLIFAGTYLKVVLRWCGVRAPQSGFEDGYVSRAIIKARLLIYSLLKRVPELSYRYLCFMSLLSKILKCIEINLV